MTLHVAEVSPATHWIFVVLQQRDGRIGSGEASLNGRETAVRDAAARLAATALSAPPDQPGAFAAGIAPAGLAEAAAVSAIDQALWDLHAQHSGVRVADAIGGARRESIAVYANINRRTRTRTPAGFAASARDALAAGFTALKVAPFDEVDPATCAAGRGCEAMQTGLARVAAVRDEAGQHVRLMVDCHWRFDEPTARTLIGAAATLGVYWVECPLPETADNVDALVRLRGEANGRGVRLAGLELGIGVDAFLPWCKAGAYDVVMPDVKYVGGLMEMQRCADVLAPFGVTLSPHNPTGPICHAASLHASAALNAFDMLELQFDETPLFERLVGGRLPVRADGHSALPSGAGLGVSLDAAELAAHARAPAITWHAAA
ncbi:MAG TPA: enolase C-terminal domain-like protein [Casimicrobiaceae bacterium]|jgi:galactonate dehydratase|nr:enolase C-terminal domain-like protein [Casimicrobiaceae bacterium]